MACRAGSFDHGGRAVIGTRVGMGRRRAERQRRHLGQNT